MISSTLPRVVPGSKPKPIDGFPVEAYSYSSMQRFCTNPILFRIQDINRDVIETTKSSNAVLGEALHYGIKCFLGGDDKFPVPNDDQEALKIALDATLQFLNEYPDGFVDWKANVPDRGALIELALKAIPGYVREWDRTQHKSSVMVEKKLKEAVSVVSGNREISLPVPMVGYPDHVYMDPQDRLCIEDHKTTFQYSDANAVDGGKLIQAAIYYLLVYSYTGVRPYKMTFREYKISQNKDGSPQTREYVIEYDEMQIVFDFFFRLYQDITDAIMGKQVFVPNIRAMFDRDVAVMAYIYRLDEPEILEKEKKKARIEDVAQLMQSKMASSKHLRKFMEAKANLFTSHITLDYKSMQSHEKIKYKLMEHGMSVNFADKVEGLSVELYRFEPSVGIKMATLEKYTKDIEQVLGVAGVRILAPIPGTSYVGFEIPRKAREFVGIEKAAKPASLEVSIGVDVYGVERRLDLREAPHVLVGGTTGSGKSVFIHALLQQLTQLPKTEIQLALLDPKMVELRDYEDDPHTEFYRDDAAEILKVLSHYIKEMRARYTQFKKKRVKSLEEWRAKVDKKLPYVVIVVDEFGDLMMSPVGKEIKEGMIILAQKARAAGIHLIITTQRPSAKIVDGLIKANFPTRIAFRTASRIDSEIITDRMGAELLLGKGDMLLSSGKGLERLQGFDLKK